jgi:formate dehydrogenase subunit delta
VSGGPEKLVYMANQIARFFDSQPGDIAAQAAQHLKSYWDPSMRRALVAHLHAGGDGLSPTAREAARLIGAELGDVATLASSRDQTPPA